MRTVSGEVYYVNHRTKTTSWERPVGPPADVTESHNTSPFQSGKASCQEAKLDVIASSNDIYCHSYYISRSIAAITNGETSSM